MEYLAWIDIPGLPHQAEDRWAPFIEHLETHHGKFGPAIGWEGEVAQLTLSIRTDDPALASRVMFDAVADSLREAGLSDLYPARVEIEPTEDTLVPA